MTFQMCQAYMKRPDSSVLGGVGILSNHEARKSGPLR